MLNRNNPWNVNCQFAENGSEHGPCQWWGPHPCWGEVKQRHCVFYFNETLFLQKRQIVIHSNVVNWIHTLPQNMTDIQFQYSTLLWQCHHGVLRAGKIIRIVFINWVKLNKFFDVIVRAMNFKPHNFNICAQLHFLYS